MRQTFKIRSDVSLSVAKPVKRGRKPGSKDTKKSLKRSLLRSKIVIKAADEIRDGLSNCIFKTARKNFHEHVVGRKGNFSAEEIKERYAERVRDFENMIAIELRRNPKCFQTFWVLGAFHKERMKNSMYRFSKEKRAKSKTFLMTQLKSLGIVE